MQAKRTASSWMAIGLMAAAAAAFAQGPGAYGGGMGMMGPRVGAPLDPAQHALRVQARLDGLKAALKLQPGQADAWNAYEAKARAEAQARASMRQGMAEKQGDAQAMADYRVTMMKHNAQSAEEINALRKALVATLNDEQKATFDQLAMPPRFARGPAGPGYGPGPGGRGPGWGRGCLGTA